MMKLGSLYIGKYVRLRDEGIGCIVSIDIEYNKLTPWRQQPRFVSISLALVPKDGENPIYNITGSFLTGYDNIEDVEFSDISPCDNVVIYEMEHGGWDGRGNFTLPARQCSTDPEECEACQ